MPPPPRDWPTGNPPSYKSDPSLHTLGRAKVVSVYPLYGKACVSVCMCLCAHCACPLPLSLTHSLFLPAYARVLSLSVSPSLCAGGGPWGHDPVRAHSGRCRGRKGGRCGPVWLNYSVARRNGHGREGDGAAQAQGSSPSPLGCCMYSVKRSFVACFFSLSLSLCSPGRPLFPSPSLPFSHSYSLTHSLTHCFQHT
jgi:hypothetical protein